VCANIQVEKKGGMFSKVKVAITGGYMPPVDTAGTTAIAALNTWLDAEDIANNGQQFDLDEGKYHLGFPFLYW
jgi:hypothetical protein